MDSVPIDFSAAKHYLMSKYPWIWEVRAYREPNPFRNPFKNAVYQFTHETDPNMLFRVRVVIKTSISKQIVWYIGYGAPDEQDIQELCLALEDWSKTNLP